ncbi:MAG: hypothetical protein NVS2B12_32760 [Ktedonobacteraceae bacterium]
MQEVSSIRSEGTGISHRFVTVGGKQYEQSLTWAYRVFWATFFIFFVATATGKLWDRVWHIVNRFDTFWSPPHLYVATMTMFTGFLVAGIAFTPHLRKWYGPAVRMPLFPFKVPGSLIILGGGLIALSITIMLDNLWHTAFGLDETQWSLPHDMLAWDWFIIITGFIAARLAFRRYYPMGWLTNLVVAILMLEFLCPPVLGPFYLMYSPGLIHALANMPIVLGEPSAQHLYRIYLHFQLTRQTSPLFIPVVSLFAGAALTFLLKIDARKRILLLAPFLWSITLMARDLYTILFLHYNGATKAIDIVRIALQEPSLWLPIPLFVAALVFEILRHTRLGQLSIFAWCGLAFGICTFGIWHTSIWMLLLILPGTFTFVLGTKFGRVLFQLIEEPTLDNVMKFLLITCAQVPAILGVVDLIMRRTVA